MRGSIVWFAVPVALLFICGCGGDGGSSCEPTTCEAAGVECGTAPDGCGGELDCGGCGQGEVCNSLGQCIPESCTPECGARECGPDPVCGIACGTCDAGETCNDDGQCIPEGCTPDCGERACGPDPVCGESCGTCSQGEICNDEGQCIPEGCTPECGGRECGPDPVCGESCGECGPEETCNEEGQCVPESCEPVTCEEVGASCGTIPDGCGGTLVCGPPCSLDRAGEPVVVTGEMVPEIQGTLLEAVCLFRWDGEEFVPIRHQVDERVQRTIDASFNNLPIQSPELSFVYHVFGPGQQVEDDAVPGALDGDDEIVFLANDAGDPAPEDAWLEGAGELRYEILLVDPLDGQSGVVYVFACDNSLTPDPFDPEVIYTHDASADGTDVHTPTYTIHYAGNWSLDALSIGRGPDLIDRMKGRAFSLEAGQNSESEETWDELSSYVGHLSGDVRAVREIQGAASGVTTTYIAEFYPGRVVITTYLRVHAMNNIWQYIDYDSALGDMVYGDATLEGFLDIDGDPDEVALQPLRTWVQVDTQAGTLVHLYDFLDTRPLLNGVEQDMEFFYVDSVRGALGDRGDGTGDDQPAAWGNHGFHILHFCTPAVGQPRPCPDNDMTAEPCCMWQPPYGSPINVGSYFHPFVSRQIIVPLTMSPDATPGAHLRERLDNPLRVTTTLQQR